MAGGNSTTNCSYAALQQCSSKITCDAYMVSSFDKSMGEKIWRMNSLLLISAILAGTIVGIGIYAQRYRHHRFTRFIFLGATTLFLPVVSTVVSMGAGDSNHSIGWCDMEEEGTVQLIAKCEPRGHTVMVVVWASLVQIVMVNTSAVVAVDDREGGNTAGPPLELLVQGVWTFYLGISYAMLVIRGRFGTADLAVVTTTEAAPFALTCAKMVFKYYAFEKGRLSFALGRNPQLIFGHMKQQSLQETGQAEDAPPRLLVMGEDKRHVEKHPLGYVYKDDSWATLHNNGLVTIDRVWRLDNVLPTPTLKPQKDLCLSFALFKLLRCRFARYKVGNATSKGTFSFFWSLLLKDGEHDRVFLLISDELSFLHDYYYSSLPISYSMYWLPIAGIVISLLTIAYCCFLMNTVMHVVLYFIGNSIPQIKCAVFCIREQLKSNIMDKNYGRRYLDLVPVTLLLVLVVMSEVRDIAAYICSNWTKVAVTCHLVNHASSQHSPLKKKWIVLLLRCRCKLMKHWDEKIGQCTMLEIQPRTTLPVLLRRLLHLPDHKKKIKVPAEVKICIMEVVRSTRNGELSNGTASLRLRGQVGERLLWACNNNNNKSTSYTILTWHIATRILEVRYPHRLDQEQQGSCPIPNTDYKIVATHLSRYCTYLVTWCPELLPDDDEWSRSLYEDVKKDAERVLAGCTAGDSLTPEANYQQLIQVLSADAKHAVLMEGARLGKQLVELMVEVEGEDTAWKLLAEFWSEMIVYVAPSDNLKGHSEAIARGGELITLLWVLLFHAGIVSRPGEDDSVAPTSAGAV